jgi:hypothetical protein
MLIFSITMVNQFFITAENKLYEVETKVYIFPNVPNDFIEY